MCVLFMSCTSTAQDDLLTDDYDLDMVDMSPETLDSTSYETLGTHEQVLKTKWLRGMTTSFDHSQTQIEEGRQFQRSSARWQYENAIAASWFLSLDYKAAYYYDDDTQAQQQDGAYGRGRWQQAWLQYSDGACAYKVGKQTLIWGAVEGTFVVDVVTPFDYTEQLLTDYNSIRLAQTMVLSECFLPQVQTQLFYVPEARHDLISHGAQPFEKTSGQEFGGLIKFNWPGGDVSLMAAQLHPNQPTLIPNAFLLPEWESDVFTLYGLSSSVAMGRLLLKSDIGFKQGQRLNFTGSEYDSFELAAGFEYTTFSNHSINGGFWFIKDLNDEESASQSPLYTFGWNKTYLNDDLALSVLGNVVTDPELYSATGLAQYQWDDYWTFSLALSFAELKDRADAILLAPPEEAITVQAKYQF